MVELTEAGWADKHPIVFSLIVTAVILAAGGFLHWQHPTVVRPGDLLSFVALGGLPVVHACRTVRRVRTIAGTLTHDACAIELIRGTQAVAACVLVAVVVCVGVLLRVAGSAH